MKIFFKIIDDILLNVVKFVISKNWIPLNYIMTIIRIYSPNIDHIESNQIKSEENNSNDMIENSEKNQFYDYK